MITKRNLRYFKVAENLASLSTYKNAQHGCVIVYKNKIISTGFNKDRTDPLQGKYNIARFSAETLHKIHAEIDAIKHILDLDLNWHNVCIYIIRKRKDRRFGLARPCPACMSLIKEVGIRHVYYTTNDGYAYEYIEE